MLMQYVEPQLIRPPVLVRRASAGSGFVSSARYRALTIFIHKVTSFRRLISFVVSFRIFLKPPPI
jgi:hypothetical protein